MKYSVIYDEKINVLIAKFSGELSKENAGEFINEIAKVAKKHNCKRIINDLNEADIKLTISDLFSHPHSSLKEEFDASWKRAIVVKKLTEEMTFFETTAQNQCVRVKVFCDFYEALEWLNKKQTF